MASSAAKDALKDARGGVEPLPIDPIETARREAKALIDRGEYPKAASLLLTLEGVKPIELPGAWLRDIGDLSESPPKRRWLLSDVRTEKKVLRMGKCAVAAADGGVGKSFLWLQLTVCIALGRDLFDTFRPEQAGHVALLMGEDDREECFDRLHRICNAIGASRDEREQVASRILLFPLAGHEVAFLELDQAKNPRRTAVLESIVKRLTDEAEEGGFGWSFVGIDPLARFASGNAESDNGIATAFVQSIESIAIGVPGEPAVGVTHHSSKVSIRTGSADVRGVTGLRNAFRAAFTMTKAITPDGVRGVLLENTKNNLAPEADPVWLVRMTNEQLPSGQWLETGGVLRRATDEEASALTAACGMKDNASPEQRAQARQTRKRSVFETDCGHVLEILPDAPKHMSMAALCSALEARGVSSDDKRTKGMLEYLAGEDGGERVVDLSNGSRGRARQWAKAKVEP